MIEVYILEIYCKWVEWLILYNQWGFQEDTWPHFTQTVCIFFLNYCFFWGAQCEKAWLTKCHVVFQNNTNNQIPSGYAK